MATTSCHHTGRPCADLPSLDSHKYISIHSEVCKDDLSPLSVTMDDIIMHDQNVMMEVGSENGDMTLNGTDSSDFASQICSDEEEYMMDNDEESNRKIEQSVYLLSLPSEIRLLIFKNLLLSDSAFRLGHHGPYSHEPRNQLYPEILRTCSIIHEEATEILYGNNTFVLGTIGHKPTYSASFITSIGRHNAQKIRNLAAHSNNPLNLRESYLHSWIASFQLDSARIRSLAISFPYQKESIQLQDQSPTDNIIIHNLSLQWTNQNPQLSVATNQVPATLLASVPIVASTPVVSVTSNTVPIPTSSNSIVSYNDNSTSSVTTVIPTPTILQQSQQHQQRQLSTLNSHNFIEKKMSPLPLHVIQKFRKWGFELVDEYEVSKWVMRKNTDLRSSDMWLLYVSPIVRKRRALRY